MIINYIGAELKLFSRARNWKTYIKMLISPFLGNSVLEVGAGIGSNTRVLCQASHHRWVCLEPDRSMVTQLHDAKASGEIPPQCEIYNGMISDFSSSHKYDSVLYIDVLEHIKEDDEELQHAVVYLKPGGKIIIF